MDKIISEMHVAEAIASWRAAEQAVALFGGDFEMAKFAITTSVGHGIDRATAELLVYHVEQLQKEAA